MSSDPDRRVQRSRQQLLSALGSLMSEKPFDKITVQDIIERADVGRTTFYAHFQSKEDLFLSSHAEIIDMISESFAVTDGLPPQMTAFLEMVHISRDTYFFMTWGSETGTVLRLLKERIAARLAARLHEVYREEDSTIPFAVLAQHIAGSMVSVLSWWLDKRSSYSAKEISAMLYRMNQAALHTALGHSDANSQPSAS